MECFLIIQDSLLIVPLPLRDLPSEVIGLWMLLGLVCVGVWRHWHIDTCIIFYVHSQYVWLEEHGVNLEHGFFKATLLNKLGTFHSATLRERRWSLYLCRACNHTHAIGVTEGARSGNSDVHHLLLLFLFNKMVIVIPSIYRRHLLLWTASRYISSVALVVSMLVSLMMIWRLTLACIDHP